MRRATLILALTLLAAGCAKQGYPTGGPKDMTPPAAVGATPANATREFGAKQFYIEFDEYVVLKDATNNVLVSPPLKYKPEYTTKGKGIVVKLKDTLQANTTYLFQFKDAIADFTEGNVLPSYEYVFSTGGQMDTMMMEGRVVDALTGKAWKETVTVAAYGSSDTGDTVATHVQPTLVTRCDKEGRFAFHYIPAGRYRIVAFEDANRNLRLDATEAAAWDSVWWAAADSIDSTATSTLLISAPDHRKQRVLKSEFAAPGLITIVTQLPMQAPVLAGEAMEWRLNPGRDTMRVWCMNAKCDSAVVTLTDEGLNDTLRLRYRQSTKKGNRGTGSSGLTQKDPLMKALCSGSTAYYDSLYIGFANPIAASDAKAVARVLNTKDSTRAEYPIVLDSSGMRARIQATLKSGETYSIHIADSLFTDIYGEMNDSLVFTLTPKDYGILTLHLTVVGGQPLVVEVVDKNDTVVQRQPAVSSATLKFTHLPAGDYRIRAIYDNDSNGRWTPGNYRLQRQPEKIVYQGKTLQLREKWEMEEHWTVGERNAQSKLLIGSKTGKMDGIKSHTLTGGKN